MLVREGESWVGRRESGCSVGEVRLSRIIEQTERGRERG